MRPSLATARRDAAPVLVRGTVLAGSAAAAAMLVSMRGLALFGLLMTLQFVARLGGALLLGEARLALSRRDTTPRAVLTRSPGALPRVIVAIAGSGAAALVVSARFDSRRDVVALLVVMTVALVVVSALLTMASIKLAQSQRTSLSAISDISTVGPIAALTFTIPDLHVAAALQTVMAVALAAACVVYLLRGEARRTPLITTPAGDLIAFAVAMLPMMHGSVGPVLGVFGLDAEAVGLLALAQRLCSAAPLILAGGNAAVLAAPPASAREPTLRFARWGAVAFAVISLGLILAWPAINDLLNLSDAGLTVLVLVVVANLINVAAGPVGHYCAVAGLQRFDLTSLTLAMLPLVPFMFFAHTATQGAAAAVTVAAVRASTIWILIGNSGGDGLIARVGPPTADTGAIDQRTT